jgi:glycosyl transferase family 25
MQPPIFVINLDSSPERFRNTKAQFENLKINVTRLPGVLGNALSDKTINQSYSKYLNFKKSDRPLSKGEIGCYLSHRKAWQKIVDMDVPFGVVVEDDIFIEELFEDALNAISNFSFNWDLIKLAPYKNKTRSVRIEKQISSQFKLVINSKTITGCAGYAISRSAAIKLLRTTYPFFRPVDTDLQHFWEHNIDIYALHPFVVKQDLRYESDIGSSRKKIPNRMTKKVSLQIINYFINKSKTKAACKRFLEKL